MATGVLTNAKVWYDGAEFSPFMFATENEYGVEAVDDTTMGTAGTRSFAAGLKVASIDVDFYADEAASKVNVLLFPDVGVSRTVLVRPTSSAVSTTNPNYTLTAMSTTLTPLSGTVGAMNTVRVSYVAFGGGALSRATS